MIAARQEELASLTSARGIAAWMVVLYHVRAGMSGWMPEPLIELFAKGYLAVDFFFILSGFVIYLSSHGAFEREGASAYRSFLIKRIARIYPLYLFILLGTIGFVLALNATGRLAEGNPWSELPLHFLMLQNWGFTADLTWNHPAWSISCEFAAYLLFPILVLVLPIRKLPRWAMPLAALAMLMITYALFRAGGMDTLGDKVTIYGLARCLPEFAAGAILAAYWLSGPRHSLTQGAISLAISAALLAAWIWGPLLETIAFPVAMLALIHGLAHLSGVVGNPLDSWPLHYLGEISYATYLCHFMMYVGFKLLFVSDRTAVSPALLGLFVALVLIASVALYHLIERPGQRLIRERFFRQPAPVTD